MIIDDINKCLFIHIPKCAGTSVTEGWKTYWGNRNPDPLPEIHHMNINECLKNNPHCKDYFKFVFVRNPWERLLSGYSDFKQYDDRKDNINDIDRYKNFEEFCYDFSNSHWIKNIHFLPQVTFMSIDEKIVVDRICRVENFTNEIDSLYKESKIPIGMHHIKKYRTTSHNFYRDVYTKDMIEIVEEIYKDDIKEFGYKF